MKNFFLLFAIVAGFLVATLFFFVPISSGKINQFKDEGGNIMENSISEKTFIEVKDGKIGTIILGENINNPVLLVCGGGPGISQYLLEYLFPSVLPKYFVVCYFDYRGTGRSFDKNIDCKKIDTEKYLEDVNQITDYLRERFSKNKIYILGHSFGSYIALNTVIRNPEKYISYFAVSQDCNQEESEYRAYDYMFEQYKKMNNKKMIKEFEKNQIRKSKEDYNKYIVSGLRDKAMHNLGIGTSRDMKSVISGIFFPSLKCKALSIKERFNLWRGKLRSNKFKVTEEAFNFNGFEKIKSIEIPIYFFVGEYDFTCCHSLQKEYFEFIEAPIKKMFLYKDAAHSPIYEDKEMTEKYFKEILEN